MKNKRKLLLSMLSIVMVFSLLVGCAGKSGGEEVKPADPPKTEATTPGTDEKKEEEKPEVPPADVHGLGKEPLKISIFGNYDWYAPPKWGSEPSSKWIVENKLVEVDAQSSTAAAQKLQTMMVGGTLPDVVWGERVDMKRLYEADMLVPLDDYIDKYPNFKKWVDKAGMQMLRAEDGKLYQLPNWYSSIPYGNAGYVVNKKIFKELGEPKLETTDDLYAYLKMVKEKFPDVVPFETGLGRDGQGFDQLFSAFKENNLTYQRYFSVPTGDKFTSIYKDEAFREATAYSAKLYREKLLTQDSYTQTRDQVLEKLMNGRVAVYANSNPTTDAMQAHGELTKNDPDAGYFMIWPIHKAGLDKSKIYPGTYNTLGWNVAVITKNAKDPERVFAFLDWLTGPEGSAVMMWGAPGPDGYWSGFDADGETPLFTDKYGSDAKGLQDHQAKTDPFMWVGNTVYVDQNKGKHESTLPENQRNWATNWQYQVTWQTQGNFTELLNLDPLPETDAGIARTAVNEIWQIARAKAHMAASDEEVFKVLDQAHDDSMKVGFQTYLDHISQKWAENKTFLASVK